MYKIFLKNPHQELSPTTAHVMSKDGKLNWLDLTMCLNTPIGLRRFSTTEQK